MTSPRIAIVDYGTCNLFSVEHACRHVGMPAELTSDPDQLRNAAGIILPGVGSFKDAMHNLQKRGLDQAIREAVQNQVPFLGICLGLQLLFEQSEEFGTCAGLGILKGKVARIPMENGAGTRKIPHMGWSPIQISDNGQTILDPTTHGRCYYFVHSYYVQPESPMVVASTTTYDGFSFCSSVSQGNLFACQFHPEKSGRKGLNVYRNWHHLTLRSNTP